MSSRWLALLAALCLCAAPHSARAGEGDTNPHHMSSPDDDEGCGFCHEEDMSLTNSLLDTCLTCHSITEHSGSQEHIRATAADVARLPQPTPVKAGAEPKLPLTKEGTIWCGTCHLYHDPQVNQEALLPEKWRPPMIGMPGAVADALAGRWGELAGKYDQKLPVAKFSAHGTDWLRLSVADGSLCTECHRYTGKVKK